MIASFAIRLIKNVAADLAGAHRRNGRKKGFCSGGGDRTRDLKGMNLASYLCSTPRYFYGAKMAEKARTIKQSVKNLHFIFLSGAIMSILWH